MENKKLLLIVNPCSGKAKMRTALFGVVEIFAKADFDVTVYPTKEREDATKKVASLKSEDFDLIVACGGDGTLNEVITGLMESGADIPIGYIPAGTLNEWSTGLGISKVIRQAAKDIVKGKEIALDIGQFGEKYFTYTASFGAFTSASYSANQDIKNVLGQAAYFFEGIKSLGTIKPIHLKFKADDREIEGDFLFGAISNSMSVGGIVKFDQAAVQLNDGLFEVLLIKVPKNLIELQKIIDAILKKDLENNKYMEFFKVSSLKIKSDVPIDWTLDGEHAVSKTLTNVEIIPNRLNIFLPEK